MTSTIPAAVSKMSIFDDFECIGQWDIPALGNGLCGRLVRDKNGIRLDVMSVPERRDVLQQLMSGMTDRSVRTVPYIRGIAETGEHVVLGKCSESRREFHAFDTGPNDAGANPSERDAPGVVNAQYNALSMHASRVPLPDSPTFDYMNVTYTSLSQWLGQNQAHVKPSDDSSLSVTIDMPEDHEVRISDELSLRISRTGSVGKNLLKRVAYTIDHSESIRFASHSPRPPSWFYGHAETFRNFMMMATRYPVHAETFRSGWDGHEIGVLPAHAEGEKPEGDNHILNMYFNYLMIKGAFDRMVVSWFGLAEKYRVTMDLYFTSRLGLSVPPKLDFLSGVQALEAFFRAKNPGRNASLKEMLSALIDGSYEQFDTEREKSDFVSNVVDTRDSISHGFLEKPRDLVSKPIDLYYAAAKAGLLIYGCILRELDADDEIKNDIFKRKRSYVDSIRFIRSY